MTEEFHTEERSHKYFCPCPWCHARLSFDQVPRIDIYMCPNPNCNEFFAIDKVDYSTGEVLTIKVDTLLSFQAKAASWGTLVEQVL